MTNAIELQAQGDLLEVSVSGKLTREFYERFVPAVERLLAEKQTVRILLEMHDFHGWTAGALWEDLKFDLKHWNDIERLALVGEARWQEGMARFCRPFTRAEIRYFERGEEHEARVWLREGSELDPVDEAGRESFPASDPPSSRPGDEA